VQEDGMGNGLVVLAVSAIYLGAAGAAGALARRIAPGRADWLPAGYAAAVALGGAALILATPGWAAAVRVLLAAAGVAAGVAGFRRPGWLPQAVWRRAFGRGYLAGAMALAALWGLSQGLSGPSPLLIGLSALGAGAASSGTALARNAETSA
jgi:hypothetical protein